MDHKMKIVKVGRRTGTQAGIGAYWEEAHAIIARDAAKAALQCTPMNDLEVWIEDEP